MLVQIGANSYRIVKKRAYKRRTLIHKNDMRKMLKYVFAVSIVLTIATAAMAQIKPLIFESGERASEPIAIVAPMPAPETTEQTIRRLAKEANFKWPEYLVRLAKCENPKMNPKNYNDGGNHPVKSRDRGQFMINNYWNPQVSDECAYDLTCATKWTMEMINSGHQGEWVCDKKVRNKK